MWREKSDSKCVRVRVRVCGMDGRFLGKPGIRKESMSDVIVNETFIT